MRRSLLLACLPLVAAAGSTALASCGDSSSDAPPACTDCTAQEAGPDGDGTDADAAEAEAGSLWPSICVATPEPAPWPGDDKCPSPKPPAADTFDEALTLAGLDRCAVMILPQTAALSGFPQAKNDPWRLPDYDPLHRGPLRLPGWARETASWLDAAHDGKAPVSSAIAVASLRRGHAFKACLEPNGYDKALLGPMPLAEAIAILREHNGAAPDRPTLQTDAAPIPLDVQKALVPVIAAIDHAWTVSMQARKTTDVAELDWLSTVWSLWQPTNVGGAVTTEYLTALAAVDVNAIVEASSLLAAAVEAAKLGSIPASTFKAMEADTPIGAVMIHGDGADTYKEDTGPGYRAALLVDLGGDDTYEIAAGGGNMDLPVSVLIDVRGVDQYRYPEYPIAADKPGRMTSDYDGRNPGKYRLSLSKAARQGSALLGAGMLFDLGQEGDMYRSLVRSQGVGVLGVGVLWDAGGDDDYRCEGSCQGAAGFGIGLLLDRDGNDQYRAYSYSQGFGYSQGVGILSDAAGKDLFFVNPGDPNIKADPELPDVGGDPMYPSAQLPDDGNNSMSQGCGFGRRADMSDGKFMGGGFGMLHDRSGDDTYVSSVFAQGAGYFRAIGVLMDEAGDDQYGGLWYVQGAAAHLGIGLQIDHAGSDKYNVGYPIRATSIGTSNDFSVGMHLDEGGDDIYNAPGLSLGSGYAQGFGILVNSGGNDQYTAGGYPTLGGSTISGEFPYTIARSKANTIGVFVDDNGADQYKILSEDPDAGPGLGAGDDKSWQYQQILLSHPDAGVPNSEKSAGVDRNSGSAVLP